LSSIPAGQHGAGGYTCVFNDGSRSIARHNPDLKNELKIIIEDELPYAKRPFIARSKKYFGK
jgi:hypothetical protein